MEEDDGRGRARSPRRRIYLRASIFIGLAAVAQASAALPSGPTDPGYYWASLAIFVVCALSILLPWSRFPRWAILFPTIGYLVSVTFLLISGGTDPTMQSTAGGLSAVVLLPVLGMALYYPGLYTAIVVGAVLGEPGGRGRGGAEQRSDGSPPALLVGCRRGGGRHDRAPPPQQPRREGAGFGGIGPSGPAHERGDPVPHLLA